MHAQGAYAPKEYGVFAVTHNRDTVQDVSTHPSTAYARRDSSVAPFAYPAVAKSAWGNLRQVLAPVHVGVRSPPYEP